MLVDVDFMNANPLMMMLAMLEDGEKTCTPYAKGIYLHVGYNLHNLLDESWRNSRFKYGEEAIKEMPEREKNGTYIPPHGVIDSPAQLVEKFGKLLEEDKKYEYVVGMTRVLKSVESESGGWRWHKWGEYYGTQEPSGCEYIYDEPVIEEVWCFSIEKRLPQKDK